MERASPWSHSPHTICSARCRLSHLVTSNEHAAHGSAVSTLFSMQVHDTHTHSHV